MECTATARSSMVRKLTRPRAERATALARETGIAQPILSRWLREAGGVMDVDARELEKTPARRPQDWTLEEVLVAVLEASRLSGEELARAERTGSGSPAACARRAT
jgi:hypothetical protein